MRWFRLSRRRRGPVAPDEQSAGFRSGSWSQAAVPVLPPPEPHPVPSLTGNVSLVPPPATGHPAAAPAAPLSAIPAPPQSHPPVAGGEGEKGSGVRLGFADGTDIQLDPEHPHSLALKAVAEELTARSPSVTGQAAPGGGSEDL